MARRVKGRAATMTHDYKRHGTTTLSAALDVKSGMVIGDCMPRHRAREFLTFLRRIDCAVRKPRDIHLVLDNYATHKTPEVQAWMDKHPRFKLHFTPTGRGCRHRPDGPRHPRRHPPIASASVMRMTAIHAQTERKRQDRSACFA